MGLYLKVNILVFKGEVFMKSLISKIQWHPIADRINKLIGILFLAIGLCLASPVAKAQNLIEYALIGALGGLDTVIQNASPSQQAFLIELHRGSILYDDGVTNNFNESCTYVQYLLAPLSPSCTISTATHRPIAFISHLSDAEAASLSWSTNAALSDGTLLVSASNPRLANFTALAPGTYQVTALGPVTGGVIEPITITVTAQDAVNANAGLNETVNINSLVSLDGSGSTSTFNSPLTYHWSFISVPQDSQAAFSDANIVNPTFTSDKPGQYVIQLTVSTVINSVTYDDSDEVTISTNIVPPIADAGAAQTIHPVALVTLNGSQSYDPNGLPLTYNWSLQKPAGSNAVLSNAHAVSPSFTVDVLGTYTATLVVNDGFLSSESASVVINTSNSAPVANAGASQSVSVGSLATLNGSASADSDNDSLSYHWSFVSVPSGSQAVLNNSNAASASFMPDLPGIYIVGLIVNDGFDNSAQSTAQVLAIVSASSTIQSIQELQNIINGMSADKFRNKNMQNTFTNKLNAVIQDISSGHYSEAISKMQNDILKKTNGCAETGSPSKTDWVITCAAQSSIYTKILQIISSIGNL